ncbi:MAG: hypothetical protein V4724_26515 [Pseudomonadota bacterium]
MTISSNAPEAAWKANQDIIGGLKFVATMQLRIPLRVLSRHGEVHSDSRRKPPTIAQSPHEGIWIPLLHGQNEFYGTMASTIGPITSDGGEFLQFLLAVRRIVEQVAPINERVAELRAELTRPHWQEFTHKLEGAQGSIVLQFFPFTVNTIPGLPATAKEALAAAGLDTVAKIAATPDADLLKLKGVGQAKVVAIRKWQKSIKNKDAARLDMVER